jgi:hypothetical protein
VTSPPRQSLRCDRELQNDGEFGSRDVHLVDFDQSGNLSGAKKLVGFRVVVTGETAWGATAWYYSELALDVTKLRRA